MPNFNRRLLVAAALVLQGCYWTRYRRVPVWAPFRGAVVGHLLLFAGRASFIFGSAAFSTIAFRHVPQLATLPPLGASLLKAAGLVGCTAASSVNDGPFVSGISGDCDRWPDGGVFWDDDCRRGGC